VRRTSSTAAYRSRLRSAGTRCRAVEGSAWYPGRMDEVTLRGRRTVGAHRVVMWLHKLASPRHRQCTPCCGPSIGRLRRRAPSARARRAGRQMPPTYAGDDRGTQSLAPHGCSPLDPVQVGRGSAGCIVVTTGFVPPDKRSGPRARVEPGMIICQSGRCHPTNAVVDGDRWLVSATGTRRPDFA